jgi:hypothetical protein
LIEVKLKEEKGLDFRKEYLIKGVMFVAPHRNGGAFSLYE